MGQGLFPELVNAIIYPTKWLQGCEGLILNCLTDIYRSLVLGQPSLLDTSAKSMRQDNPINGSPRSTLLHYVNIERLDVFEQSIINSKAVKDMREQMKDLLWEMKKLVNLNNEENGNSSCHQSSSSIENLSGRIFSKGLQYMQSRDSGLGGRNTDDGLSGDSLLNLFGDNNI